MYDLSHHFGQIFTFGSFLFVDLGGFTRWHIDDIVYILLHISWWMQIPANFFRLSAWHLSCVSVFTFEFYSLALI